MNLSLWPTGSLYRAVPDGGLMPPCAAAGAASSPRSQALSELDSSDTRQPSALELVEFDVDVFARKVNRQTESAPKQVALAKAVVAELQPPDWEALGQLFLAYKRHLMETMDLDTLEAEFPWDVLSGRSSMVGYAEIFPWHKALEFKLADAIWLADDQYCVAPGCSCTESALLFYHVSLTAPPPVRRLKDEVVLRHNYVSGKTETVEAKPGSPATDTLIAALRAEVPDFEAKLRRRHRQLQQLGRRLLANPHPEKGVKLSYYTFSRWTSRGEAGRLVPRWPCL